MLTPDTEARMVHDEITTWAGFANALRSDDRQAFKKMMSEAYHYARAVVNSERIIISEALFMTLLLAQHKKIQRLHSELRRLQAKLQGVLQDG